LTGGGADPNAEEVHTFPFAFNTASPATVFNIPAGARILTIGLQIGTAFDDPSATIKIGDAGQDDRLMTVAQNVPSEIGEYESNPIYQYVSATNILLTISPGTSTQGSGVVIVEFNLNT
jgi:hypothetical protein